MKDNITTIIGIFSLAILIILIIFGVLTIKSENQLKDCVLMENKTKECEYLIRKYNNCNSDRKNINIY